MKEIETQIPQTIKVLHPITRLIVGGAQENTMYTAAMLDPQQFKAEIFSGPQTGSEGSLIDEVRQRSIPLTISPHLLREISLLNDFQALVELTRYIHRNKFHIVHTHSSKAGVLGRLAAKLARVPVIIHTVHGWSFHDYMSPRTRKLYILLERWAASFTDKMIVVAQRDIQKGLKENIGEVNKYQLIRSAIPLTEFDPELHNPEAVRKNLGIPPEAIIVGNIGRFSPQKNPLEWVRIAGELGRAFPEIFFLLVGDGPLHSQVENLLEEENIANRTILTGLRRDVPRLLSAIDIFLLTSLWEGLPRVIPQAMSMGIPVVANRADGTIEAIQDGITGFLCTPGDKSSIVSLLSELVHNPIKRQEIGRMGRDYALKEFDLYKMIHQIESIYYEQLAIKMIST
jgi:glycosyltransferase involved in cell wall biosynthesis